MRDDLHRHLPLRLGWKQLLRSCRSEAELVDAGRLYDNAMKSELKMLARGGFVDALASELAERQPALPGMFYGLGLRERAHDDYRDLLIQHAERMVRANAPHRVSAEDVLESAITEIRQSVRRRVELTVLSHDFQNRGVWLGRFDQTASEFSTRSYVEDSLAGSLRHSRRAKIDLDAPLTPGPALRDLFNGA